MNQRLKSVEEWAKYVKNSNGEWKKYHTIFIDSQFIKTQEFIKNLSKKSGGKEKIAKLYKIKNKKGYPSIFN